MFCSTMETAMAVRTRTSTETEEHIALKRNRLVLEQARAVGLLGEAKNTRLSGRVPAGLIEAAKKRAHVSSDTELLAACPNSRCSILSESDSTLDYEQVFSPLEYRSDTAAAAECAGLRAERPCLAVYR